MTDNQKRIEKVTLDNMNRMLNESEEKGVRVFASKAEERRFKAHTDSFSKLQSLFTRNPNRRNW